MNAKVQEFIDKMEKEEKRERDEKLISLGLIDENRKTIRRVYINCNTPKAKYDNVKNQYYIEKLDYAPIDVTEDEYKEILKYSPFAKVETAEIKEISTTWAKAIDVIAKILLVVNISGGFILWRVLEDSIYTDDYAWIPIVFALLYCILYYPLIVGFSKIVAVAERKLQE